VPLTFDSIRALALKLPDVEDSTAYGQPALRVKGKILAATGHEPGSFAIKMPIDRRDELIAAAPDTYHVTDHYRPHAWVLVRYATVHPDALPELLRTARQTALAATKRRR